MISLTGTCFVGQVSRDVNIPDTNCFFRLLPQQKLDWIVAQERTGARVMMIGDGINDSAALAGENNKSHTFELTKF